MIASFGPLDFQLMLLRRMADFQPDLVEQATRTLGAGRRAVADANRRWQFMIRSRTFPGGTLRLRLVLGRPEAVFSRRFGDVISEVSQWPLPLWPDLRYEAIALPGEPDAPVLQEWLVRPDPGTGPELRTAADAAPWTCVVADLDSAFPPVRHQDGDAPTRWIAEFSAPDEQGKRTDFRATFVHGLLQTLTPAASPGLPSAPA